MAQAGALVGRVGQLLRAGSRTGPGEPGSAAITATMALHPRQAAIEHVQPIHDVHADALGLQAGGDQVHLVAAGGQIGHPGCRELRRTPRPAPRRRAGSRRCRRGAGRASGPPGRGSLRARSLRDKPCPCTRASSSRKPSAMARGRATPHLAARRPGTAGPAARWKVDGCSPRTKGRGRGRAGSSAPSGGPGRGRPGARGSACRSRRSPNSDRKPRSPGSPPRRTGWRRRSRRGWRRSARASRRRGPDWRPSTPSARRNAGWPSRARRPRRCKRRSTARPPASQRFRASQHRAGREIGAAVTLHRWRASLGSSRCPWRCGRKTEWMAARTSRGERIGLFGMSSYLHKSCCPCSLQRHHKPSAGGKMCRIFLQFADQGQESQQAVVAKRIPKIAQSLLNRLQRYGTPLSRPAIRGPRPHHQNAKKYFDVQIHPPYSIGDARRPR